MSDAEICYVAFKDVRAAILVATVLAIAIITAGRMALDRLPELMGRWRARRRNWKPVGARVRFRIDDTGDPALFGTVHTGRIEAVAEGPFGRAGQAEVALDSPFDQAGSSRICNIQRLVAAPHFRHHSWARLLVTTVNVTLSASELRDPETRKHARTIGLATMRLL